ncbi:unnamed protein product [Linum trigynum]|uniref:Uncharacterized protein n=1 Tax=Linum trigynum TaxID=586398 RepID=A0AAV2DN41_9ROSI
MGLDVETRSPQSSSAGVSRRGIRWNKNQRERERKRQTDREADAGGVGVPPSLENHGDDEIIPAPGLLQPP